MKRIAETDVAAAVVAWLEREKWEVYQEVQQTYGAPAGTQAAEIQIADIVAVQGPLVWIVESKAALGLAVIEQIEGWHQYAHFRSVAVPDADRINHSRGRTSPRGRAYAERLLSDQGVGLFLIDQMYPGSVPEVLRYESPRMNRHAINAKTLRERLEPEHKTFSKAGSANGSCWSPFRRTLKYVRAYLEEHPGATFKEVIDGVDHHYCNDATARACLRQWISDGHMPEVKIRLEGKNLRLYPAVVRRAMQVA